MKYSIITINKNNAQGLKQTIESVVFLKSFDYEYIVIDGASTDGSVNIIKQYETKIDYWVSEPDTGIYNAMNKGIEKAKGDYCLFLNSGDWLEQQNIKELQELQENNDYDIIYGNVNIISGNKDVILLKPFGRDFLTLYDFFENTICHQSTLIKKRLFDIYGKYDENYDIVSDWIFFIKVIVLNSVTVKYVDIIISNVDGNGIGGSERAIIERNKALESIISKHILHDYNSIISKQTEFENQLNLLGKYEKRYQSIDKMLNKIKLFLSFLRS